MAERCEITTESMANGGDAVGRDGHGRAIFVTGALPGERVVVEIDKQSRSFSHAHAVSILDAADQRREPPCPHVARGCGGCGWQHIQPDAQRQFKVAMLSDVLSRIGGVVTPRVLPGISLNETGYRTTVRVGVDKGRAGFRRPRSRSIVDLDSCLVSHPLVDELIEDGEFHGCREVTIRVGARTDERMVVASPKADGVAVPNDVLVVGSDELAAGRHAWYHEAVAGHVWRISATSFFQIRPDGAEALIDTIHEALGGTSGRLIDLCCGVGLLGGALAIRDPGRWRVVGVERHRPAIHDAKVNWSSIGDARIVRASIDSWSPSGADVVVADPARSGLGRKGVQAVAATGAQRVVLVSCDAGSLGRDTKLLGEAGYEFVQAALVDLFGQTPHLEAVSVFNRS